VAAGLVWLAVVHVAAAAIRARGRPVGHGGALATVAALLAVAASAVHRAGRATAGGAGPRGGADTGAIAHRGALPIVAAGFAALVVLALVATAVESGPARKRTLAAVA